MGPGLRRDDKNYSRGAMRPKFCKKTLPSKSEGAGKTGCAPHPRSRVQCASKNAHTSIQVWRRHPAFPAQWLYGLYEFAPVTGFLATVIPPDCSAKLDASTEASGPHDFTVRFCHARQS